MLPPDSWARPGLFQVWMVKRGRPRGGSRPGSNSFHLIVARVDRGELIALERLKEKVQSDAVRSGRVR
jgi:hypothetical protein